MANVEEEKQLVQLSMFKYSEMMKQITDVEGILARLIADKKK